jgi:NAD-dependent dihydropyrimidine dehydrogenase PreA subunit
MHKIIKIDKVKCNGCGKCIPDCKEGALRIVNGKAELISEAACDGLGACLGACPQGAITIVEQNAQPFVCPGSKSVNLKKNGSKLSNWPVQIRLAPVNAEYFHNADILISADCVGFAFADFHSALLGDKVLLVGCPKLDDIELYREKIGRIIAENNVRSITYARMEVPCCAGFIPVIRAAISASGKEIPFEIVTIGIKGERL